MNDKPIDFYGMTKFLNENSDIYGECVICDVRKRTEESTRCIKCPMIFNSAVEAGKKSRIGITSTIERLFNIEKSCNIGKHQAFFFSYYPQFNFKPSEPPVVDILGTINSSQIMFKNEAGGLRKIGKYRILRWAIHHINIDNCDDRKENLGLLLNSEHTYLHKAPLSIDERTEFVEVVKQRNNQIFGLDLWG